MIIYKDYAVNKMSANSEITILGNKHSLTFLCTVIIVKFKLDPEREERYIFSIHLPDQHCSLQSKVFP